jgi:hypothetical protein
MDTTQDNWAIVLTPVGRFIGNVIRTWGPPESAGAVVTGVIVNPCYEYLSDVQAAQGPQGQVQIVGRTKILMPFDHTLGEMPIRLQVSLIAYLEDMIDTDQRNYLAAIEDVRKRIEAGRLQRDCGITIARDVPKNIPKNITLAKG